MNAVGRVNFRLLGPLSGSFSFGVGYWYQKKDPVDLDSPYPGTPRGHTDSGVRLISGLGFFVEIAEPLDPYMDGNIRGRMYVTPVLQLGLAYRVH